MLKGRMVIGAVEEKERLRLASKSGDGNTSTRALTHAQVRARRRDEVAMRGEVRTGEGEVDGRGRKPGADSGAPLVCAGEALRGGAKPMLFPLLSNARLRPSPFSLSAARAHPATAPFIRAGTAPHNSVHEHSLLPLPERQEGRSRAVVRSPERGEDAAPRIDEGTESRLRCEQSEALPPSPDFVGPFLVL